MLTKQEPIQTTNGVKLTTVVCFWLHGSVNLYVLKSPILMKLMITHLQNGDNICLARFSEDEIR